MSNEGSKRSGHTISIVDRKRPRVAVQLTEIVYDQKSGRLTRKARSHLTVYGLSGKEATAIVANAFAKAAK
jgi:hypothetical protein